MNVHLKQIALLCVMSLTAVETFAADYREDEPEVLNAPIQKKHDDRPLIDDFISRYKGKGSPRIALFWNREQTDVLVRQREKVSRTTQRLNATGTEDTASDYDSTHTLLEADGLKETVTTQTETENDDNHRSGLNEKGDVILRSTFRDVLSSAGVRFVDRAMMVRTTAAANQSSDAQISETKGLVGKADWLMELLLVKDNDAPLGYGFRVTVKSIKNSTVITEFYTQALLPLPGKQPFVAVPGHGFERASIPRPGLQDIAHSLGLEVLRELGRNL